MVGPAARLDDPGEQVRLGKRRLDPRLAQDEGLAAPARRASPSSPRSMNGLWSLIWVTCSWRAAHFASSGAPATSTQVVIDSSGTSILAANASNSAICSGVASSGGSQKLRLPSSLQPLGHPRPDRCRDRLLVELRRRPGRRGPAHRAAPGTRPGRPPARTPGPRRRASGCGPGGRTRRTRCRSS